MLPDRVSNPEPLTYESGALPIALRGPAEQIIVTIMSRLPASGLDKMKVIYIVFEIYSCLRSQNW